MTRPDFLVWMNDFDRYIQTNFNLSSFYFGQFVMARKLILNCGVIRLIGLLSDVVAFYLLFIFQSERN